MTEHQGRSGLLTSSQLPIFLGQRLHPTSPLYNMAFAFVLPAAVDRDRFQEAWRHVADASDLLRLQIPAAAEHGIAWRLGAEAPATDVLRPGDRPPDCAAFFAWATERCRQPLDLSGALVDSALVPLDDGRTGWYLNQHHLVTDASSTELLVQAIDEAYQAISSQQPTAGVPFPDYFDVHQPSRDAGSLPLQNESRSIPDRESRAAAGLYGLTPAEVCTDSTRITRVLDEARAAALERLSASPEFASLSPDIARFNVFATLLAALQHRLGAGGSPGFTAPVTGRTSAEARRALGCFIQLLPYRIEVSPGASFLDLARQCQASTVAFLRDSLRTRPDVSPASPGQVVLNFLPMRFPRIGGHAPDAVRWLHPGHSDPQHALRIQVQDFAASGQWTLHFDCNEAALPSPWRERLPEHFLRLLDAMIEAPDRPIDEVDLLLEDEAALLASVNDTNRSPLPKTPIWQRIEERIRACRDRVALREADATLTYAELGQRVRQLGDWLTEHGMMAGDRVVVTGLRSAAQVVAVLAVMRQGAAFVPVHASAPPGRLADILSNAGARLVLSSGGTSNVTTPPGVEVLDLTTLPTATAAPGLEREGAAGPRLDDEAYLIYTSGSTGKPKGVVVNHLGLADYLAWAEAEYVRGETLRFPWFTSLSFDLTVTSLFLPLMTGGTLDIYPETGDAVDTAVLDVIERNRVDFIKLTPSHLSLLIRRGLQGSALRRMVLGGEDLPTRTAHTAWQQVSGELELTNEYGPTEAVVGCVSHRYDPATDRATSVPIGRPTDHVGIEILNRAGTPVPVGVPGELWLSRPGLALRYEGQEALTHERFRPHPRLPGRRQYRTGDRVRLSGDGTMEFLGRLDRQVKISGHRIEPGEVEHVLCSIDGISEAAVVVRTREAEGPREAPVAYCTRCGLASNVPRTTLDDDGVCNVCRTFERVKDSATAYFREERDLAALFEASRRRHAAEFDCMMLYSGGKDSSYALARLVDMGLKVYAFTLDNGFISEDAKTNIREMTKALDVPVEFASTPAMNPIFRDSLERFSNVCNGCFKTIYTLSMTRAHELDIPVIVTGLSRGQMFETRLTEDLFTSEGYSPEQVDAAVLAARKTYHRLPDAATQLLDTRLFQDDEIFDAIQIVDFYRYVDVGLDEVYRYLRERVPWVRPRDTGRSTNCLINDVGITVHQQERGFHNYALPYSWDVRMGHKTREEALEELNDDIDQQRVHRILRDIDYRIASPSSGTPATLEAFYIDTLAQDSDELRRKLALDLPPALVPTRLERVERIPLAPSGKVDETALLRLPRSEDAASTHREPEGPVQSYLADLWREELRLDRVSADDHFFERGGTSLIAMQVMLRVCREFSIELPLETLFREPVLADLAYAVEEKILSDVEG